MSKPLMGTGTVKACENLHLCYHNGIITVLVGDAAQAYDLDACDSERGSATMMHPHLLRRVLPREDARLRVT